MNSSFRTYGDWRDAIPEEYEICPGCGAKGGISRDHPDGFELGCRYCDYAMVLPSDDPVFVRFFERGAKPKISRIIPASGAVDIIAMIDAMGDEAFRPSKKKRKSSGKKGNGV